MNTKSPEPFELTGRHVLLYLVAFFVVILGVQAVFIATAISTHTGLVDKQPYRKGLNYGERIKAANRQTKLGWQNTISVSKTNQEISIELKDSYGKPVLGLAIVAAISRATHDREDMELNLKAEGSGKYIAKIPEELTGSYIADIQASRASDRSEVLWRTRKRLWLKP